MEKAAWSCKVEDPKESCGLLLNIKGKERYHPCRNLSMTNHQCFILDPEDYVKADNIGEITAIIHSHPITPPTPSQADLVSCEDQIYPGILSILKQTVGILRTQGYKAPLSVRMGLGYNRLLVIGKRLV